MEGFMKAIVRGCLAGALSLGVSVPALAQDSKDSKSAPLAKQLASALAGAKLDSVAAKHPVSQNVFIGALHIPGVQLLVVAAEYPAPVLLDPRLAKGEYRDIYIELNSAGVPASKIFVEDLGANGLFARPGDNPMDMYEASGKRIMFDGEWGRQKLSEQDYMKTFAGADERYAEMLTALLAQLKKGS
jgi:hypothetical protein